MKLRKFFAASPGHDVMNAMTMGTIISLVIKGAIVGAIAGFCGYLPLPHPVGRGVSQGLYGSYRPC